MSSQTAPRVIPTVWGFVAPGKLSSGQFSAERCRVRCASRHTGRGARAIPNGSPGQISFLQNPVNPLSGPLFTYSVYLQ